MEPSLDLAHHDKTRLWALLESPMAIHNWQVILQTVFSCTGSNHLPFEMGT